MFALILSPMNLLPFDQLPAHWPRRFVPERIDWGDGSLIALLFDGLETNAARCTNAADFESWLLDWSELNAAVDEESSRRYIAMTCHASNAEAERAYLHFVEHIEPQLKPRQFMLEQIYLGHSLRDRLPRGRYEVFDRNTKVHVELYRDANVPLETEEARLCQQYQKLSGSLTVQFRGEEKTLVQMARFLEEVDRPLRQEAWELVARRRLQEADQFEQIFGRLDRELARGFQTMNELRLLDLANRKDKAPGGYQATLAEARLPFIFMNAVGVQRDVETLLHEAGHAFHALATREENLYPYRHAPIEFCEVASMSMELLGNQYLEAFYSPADARRARRDHLEGIVEVFPWIATVDAFQHWIYTHSGHTRAERTAAWLALMERFGGEVDWEGCEQARANLWHRQLHIFLHPFYYVEYGIAQLGALQVWARSKENPVQALVAYKRSLRLGGSRPLPELFSAAGCRFDFSAKTVKPLVALVRQELATLN